MLIATVFIIAIKGKVLKDVSLVEWKNKRLYIHTIGILHDNRMDQLLVHYMHGKSHKYILNYNT